MDKIVNRGAGVFRVIMKSRPVSIGCFLFTGILHFIDPRGGLRWTVWMLTGSVAVYALISLVFVLTDNNQTVGKGKKAAGDLVRSVVEDNRENIKICRDLVSKGMTGGEGSDDSTSKADRRMNALAEKHNKEPKAGKTVMAVFYAILLALSVFLFFRYDITVVAGHRVVGIMLIYDSIVGIVSVVMAARNDIPLKNRRLSFVVYIISGAAGVSFILMSWSTAELVMRISGLILIGRAIVELVIMIRNREAFLPAEAATTEIKQQGE